ncbi:MAG: hypothetical protein K2Y21_00870 [Phycisphaerales bacterium]|nr:hypothetical protein [Phycisphaerales bacterium]
MSALPFTPLTITPRPAASPHAHSPSQREGAGGRAASDSDAAVLLPSSLDPLHFNPSAATAATIINELASNEITLLDIADRHETTLEALTLWMIRPDIAERLSALEYACARRARLTVANNLNAIANTLLHLLAEAKDDHASVHRVPAATHHAFAARMQSRESARKSANLLLRIARYTPLADVAPTNPTRERGATPTSQAQPTPSNQPLSHPASAHLSAPRRDDRFAPGETGEWSSACLNATAFQRQAPTNPTRERGATPTSQAQPTPSNQPLSPPASTHLPAPLAAAIPTHPGPPSRHPQTSADLYAPSPRLSAYARPCPPPAMSITPSSGSATPATAAPIRASPP